MITQRIPSEKDKNRHKRIKKALHDQKKSFQGIATANKKTIGYIRNVSAGYFFVAKIAFLLAQEANIFVQELWPDEFAAGCFDKLISPETKEAV